MMRNLFTALSILAVVQVLEISKQLSPAGFFLIVFFVVVVVYLGRVTGAILFDKLYKTNG